MGATTYTRATTLKGGSLMPGARLLLAAVLTVAVSGCAREAEDAAGFFVTSANPGSGGDLGGLSGADAHCHRITSYNVCYTKLLRRLSPSACRAIP